MLIFDHCLQQYYRTLKLVALFIILVPVRMYFVTSLTSLYFTLQCIYTAYSISTNATRKGYK